MKKRYVIAVLLLLAALTVLVGLLVPRFGRYTEATDVMRRTTNLKFLRQAVQAYISETGALGSMFDVYRSRLGTDVGSRDPMFLLIPSMKGKSVQYDIVSEEQFAEYTDYAILSDMDGKWSVVELRHGPVGKYFMSIDNKGKLGKHSAPMLPRQLEYLRKIRNREHAVDGLN